MSAMDWKRLLVRKRFYVSGEPFDEEGRSGFQRDLDRIVFSAAFRRLQGKTQVHPLPKNDHVHNRLTHTLEVASVGRTLGTLVGLKLKGQGLLPVDYCPADVGSIVQAACTAHDIGNPPFGHACESAIGDWFKIHSADLADLVSPDEMRDLVAFDGNAQGFRILTKTEYHFHQGGMRLSYPVMATFLKYPWTTQTGYFKETSKTSCFLSESDILDDVCNNVGLVKLGDHAWCRHPLAYLVEAADDMCYKVIDVEDGIELGILDFEDYKKILCHIEEISEDMAKNMAPGVARRTFFLFRGRIFDALIKGTVDIFFRHYKDIMFGAFEGDLFSKGGGISKALDEASELCKKRVFSDRKKTMIEIGASENINTTLGSFNKSIIEYIKNNKNKDKLSGLSRKIVDHVESEGYSMPDSLYQCLRGAVDYVAGMTDNYASYVARQIGGIAS